MVLEGIAERSSLEYVVNTYISGWQDRYRTKVPNEAILASSPPGSPASSSNLDQQLLQKSDDEIVPDEPPQDEEPERVQEPEVVDEGWKDILLVDAMNESDTAVLMDFSPTQIPDTTPLNKVFHLFIMLGMSFTFVTRYGALVGVITKRDLIKQQL